MKKLIKFLVKQKYRFDIGANSLSIATFAMIASDKLQTMLSIKQERYAFVIGIILGIVGVWIVGRILDFFNYIQIYNEEANSRNETILEIKKKVFEK